MSRYRVVSFPDPSHGEEGLGLMGLGTRLAIGISARRKLIISLLIKSNKSGDEASLLVLASLVPRRDYVLAWLHVLELCT